METGLIAIVDDDELDRFIYKKIILLTCPSYSLLEFQDGREALSYVKENAQYPNKLPDIVFLDLWMPFLNGWQYLEEYSEFKSQLSKGSRHYICTSSLERFDYDYKNSSLFGYFMKPITPENVLEVVQHAEANKEVGPDDSFLKL